MNTMDSEDARRALREIADCRRQVEAEAARAPLPRWYLAGNAAGLWAMGASLDVGEFSALGSAGFALCVGVNVYLQQSMKVMPRVSAPRTWLTMIAVVAAVLLAHIAVSIPAQVLHVPRPHTLGGAAMAATFVAITLVARRAGRRRAGGE